MGRFKGGVFVATTRRIQPTPTPLHPFSCINSLERCWIDYLKDRASAKALRSFKHPVFTNNKGPDQYEVRINLDSAAANAVPRGCLGFVLAVNFRDLATGTGDDDLHDATPFGDVRNSAASLTTGFALLGALVGRNYKIPQGIRLQLERIFFLRRISNVFSA